MEHFTLIFWLVFAPLVNRINDWFYINKHPDYSENIMIFSQVIFAGWYFGIAYWLYKN